MKKLTGNIAAKSAAVLLSFVAFFAMLASCCGAVIMVESDFYTRSGEAIKAEVLESEAQSAIYRVGSMIDDDFFSNLEEIEYYLDDKNFRVSVMDPEGQVLYSNEKDGETYTVTCRNAIRAVYEDEYRHFEYYRWNQNGLIPAVEDGTIAFEDISAFLTVSIPEKMEFTDEISLKAWLTDFAYSLRFAVFAIAIVSFAVFVVLFIFLMCAAGHKNGREGVAPSFFDRIPFDLLTAAEVTAAACVVGLLSEVYSFGTMLIALALLFPLYFLILWYAMSIAVRVKLQTLFRNTVLYKLWVFLIGRGKKILRFFVHVYRSAPLVIRTLAVTLGFCAVQMLCYLGSYYIETRLLWGIFFSFVTVTAVLYVAVMLKRIKTGGEKITAGDLDHKINTQYMYGDFKEFSESLNHIGLGLQSAVNEKMKSERFRTELITNVSHDIKTPLTSIINYVDLIKKEDISNETVQSYIEVLDRQSERLKKLIEDLMEASKASTGNLPVTLAECEVGVLLSQVIGEFDDRLTKAGIKPVLKQPEEPVRILADGQHLWRVFGNLMSNVCKYSQPNTRVYLEVAKTDGRAVITFRNISKYELNISSDELMERFVRGDSSRNTEGSGLGLSIAKSLVELQNGSMELTVDGDLFKVRITFALL